MGSIFDAVNNTLDSVDNTEQSVNQHIATRLRLDQDLNNLTTTIDKQSWDACQHGGSIDPIKDLAARITITLFENFEQSDLNPTQEQLDWLCSRLDKLHDVLNNILRT